MPLPHVTEQSDHGLHAVASHPGKVWSSVTETKNEKRLILKSH